MAPQPSESPLDVSSIELDQLHPSPSHPVSSTDGQSCPNTQNAPVLIAWESLKKYVVPPPPPPSLLSNKLQGKPEPKEILSSVSGYAAPGEVLALMGPSGSGKTTLLDCLANRGSISEGRITLNATTLRKHHKRLTAYVTQDDLFFLHLSVFDQLMYTALLRLPEKSLTFNEKKGEVDKIIDQLKLNKCRNTPIMLISGGEKKRTNIGSELLTDPSVILLDEPTSGLDSTSAVGLMRTLRSLAQSGKTVITSIHQPSSSTFASFDKVMLLADGHVVYFGTPSGSLAYFADKGYPCPQGYNGADHIMDLLVVQEEGGTDARNELISIWDNESSLKSVSNVVSTTASSLPPLSSEEPVNKWNVSYLSQLKTLTHRSMRNSRSAIFTPLNLIKSAGLGLISGFIWLDMKPTESWVDDKSGFIFFAVTFWTFDSMFTAMMSFPPERAIIFKERASGSYRLSSYFFAKTVSEAPLRLTLPFTYLTISYWMSRLNPSFTTFLAFMCVQLLCVLAGESVGLLIGATVMDAEKAMVIATLVSLAQMLSGGFFAQRLGDGVKWVQYLSPFKFSYHASLRIGYEGGVECDGSGYLGDVCDNIGVGATATAEDVYGYFGGQGSVAFNVCCLFAMSVICRAGAYIMLRRMKGEGRHA